MNEMTWGFPIVVYLFLAGLGAGSFCLGAITSKRNGEGWETCARMAFLLAPFAIAAGLLILVFDLGYQTRFWMTLTVLNIYSPMSVGVWLLSIFFMVSVLAAMFWLTPSERRRIPWIGRLSLWSRQKWKRGIGVIGIPFALGVSIYTGVLLSACALPLWRSLILPFFFFLSALSLGIEGGAILGIAALRKSNPDAMKEPLQFLKRSYRVILPLYLITALIFFVVLVASPTSRGVAFGFFSGWSGWIWWIGVVGIGILLPLVLVMQKNEKQLRHAWLLSSCLITGDFLLRLVLVLAGQGAI
ncbi:MAG: polysulfide reductase NrfD [Acidobacteria bacterium]|nr:polysulfide reductase NrfD [Acidobacteriota bacterium]